jgi:uncharacterized MAPEG superfamily protein
VSTLLALPAVTAYAISCLVLIALFYVLAFRTGSVRMGAKAVVNPEDVRVYLGASVVEVDRPEVQRVKRAHLNLMENAVPFFVVGLLYAMTGPRLLLAAILNGVFVASRIVHAVAYSSGRQPIRSRAWAVGVLMVAVMAGFVVWSLIVGRSS